jgi:hypothetical protein
MHLKVHKGYWTRLETDFGTLPDAWAFGWHQHHPGHVNTMGSRVHENGGGGVVSKPSCACWKVCKTVLLIGRLKLDFHSKIFQNEVLKDYIVKILEGSFICFINFEFVGYFAQVCICSRGNGVEHSNFHFVHHKILGHGLELDTWQTTKESHLQIFIGMKVGARNGFCLVTVFIPLSR